MERSKRYTVIDILRGIAILNMVAYHALWDVVYVHDIRLDWFRSDGATAWQLSIRWAFILLSGFCWSMGRRKLKRGLLVLGCSALITGVTVVMMPGNAIWFGVLTLLGAAMLLTIPLERLFQKGSPYIGLVACCLLFLLTENVELGRVGGWSLPEWLYANHLTAFFGFPHRGFSSTDYVPLLPWLFAFWMGYFFYRIFRKEGLLRHLSAVTCPPLEWLGRHSLILYMVHQPVVYGVLYLIFR